MVITIVSGGFDPVHCGHVRLFAAARSLGDALIVIVNGDSWLQRKKGAVFMPAAERAEIIRAFHMVDEVRVYESDGDDVSEMLEALAREHPADRLIFANGGDRRKPEDIPEAAACAALGIEMAFNVGGDKAQSSSALLREWQWQAGNQSL